MENDEGENFDANQPEMQMENVGLLPDYIQSVNHSYFGVPYDQRVDMPRLRLNKEFQAQIIEEDWSSGWFGHLVTGKDMIAFFNSDAGNEVHFAINAGELIYNCIAQYHQKNEYIVDQLLDFLPRISQLPKNRREIHPKHITSFLGVTFYMHDDSEGFYTKEQQRLVLDTALSTPEFPSEIIRDVLNYQMLKAIRGGDRERLAYVAEKGVKIEPENRKKVIFNLFRGIMKGGGKQSDFDWGYQVLQVVEVDLNKEEDLLLLDQGLKTCVHMAPPYQSGSFGTRMRSMKGAFAIVQFLRSMGFMLTKFPTGEKMIRWVVQTLEVQERFLKAQPEVVEMVRELTTFLVGCGAPVDVIPSELEQEKTAGLNDFGMTLAYTDRAQFSSITPSPCTLSRDILTLIFQIAYGPLN